MRQDYVLSLGCNTAPPAAEHIAEDVAEHRKDVAGVHVREVVSARAAQAFVTEAVVPAALV